MDIIKILKQLELEKTGHYENEFYIIDLEDSDEAARTYTKLDKNAVNIEYPCFTVNSNNNTNKVTNYFELESDGNTYLIFLISNYLDDTYYVKIGEKK